MCEGSTAATERPWCPSGEPAAWGLSVDSRLTEYGGTKRVEVSSIRDGYVYVRDLPDESSAASWQELCTSCMRPIEPGQEWCKTPQCDTDLRDSNNRIPASWVGKS